MHDSLLIQTLRKQPVSRTPVWLMRQAGRYLPEYRQIRAKAGSFLDLCQTPSLACEATLQPLRRFDLDAAIVFSDILTLPEAMGLGLEFVEHEGPRFRFPLIHPEQVEDHSIEGVIQKLSYVMETIQLVRAKMPPQLPLIGFSGSPWTLACYMVEGQSSRTYSKMLSWMYRSPETVHRILHWLSQALLSYLLAQIQAGAQILMIFDTWGGLLSPLNYVSFSLSYLQQMVSSLTLLHPDVPVILFSKGANHSLTQLAQTGATAIGLDWTVDIQQARVLIGQHVALQGNLDPAVLLTDQHTIAAEVLKVLQRYGKGSGHVFNLGHGITPDVPPEHVQALVAAVHQFSPEMHL